MTWAIALLALGALSLLGVLIYGLRLSGLNREATQAAQLAQQLLENSRGALLPTALATFDGAAGDPRVNGFPPAPFPSVEVAGQTYFFKVVSEPVAAQTSLYSVRVKVSWNGNHQAELQTYYYRP